MADTYSENLDHWANSEAKSSIIRRESKALGNRRHVRDNDAGLSRIEPVRLTFDTSAASPLSSTGQYAASVQGIAHSLQMPSDN